MRVSVVIPALNEAACIQRAVNSCWNAGFEEVIVVDGGSQDDTPRLAADCGARVLRGLRGRAVQQNLGADQATGDVLLFLHADNWLAPHAGQQLRSCLAAEDALAGAFHQRIESDRPLFRVIERGNIVRAKLRGLAYGDQAIFMRRTVFDQLGGFPNVGLMEDLLLMRSFRKIGRLHILPGPVYVHPRRWEKQGILLRTLGNWSLICAEKIGVSPNRLARFYPAHDD